jgi:4-carboxymuconolactone decarboxylase
MSQAFHTILGNLQSELEARQAVVDRSVALAQLGTLLGCRQAGSLLGAAFSRVLRGALTLTEVEDLVIHSASYVGFAFAGEALAMLQSQLDAHDRLQLAGSIDRRSSLPPAQRFEQGAALYAIFDAQRVSEQLAFYSGVSADYYRHVMGTFGCTFGRESFTVREREIVTVAMLAAMASVPKQLAFHVRVALEQGVRREELAEVLLHTQLYAGLPAANNAATTMLEVSSAVHERPG